MKNYIYKEKNNEIKPDTRYKRIELRAYDTDRTDRSEVSVIL